MEIRKNKRILTVVLLITIVVTAALMLVFVMNRPTLVLSDMVSYAPTTIEINTAEEKNNTATITKPEEIEQLLSLLKVSAWEHHSDSQYNSGSDINFKCAPNYYVQLNDYQLQLLCKDDVEGYVKIEIRSKEYHYTIPVDIYTEIEAYVASH